MSPRDESIGGQTGIPDLDSYDRFIVAFSGGKDSLALLLHLLDLGVPRSKIELHHHLVDGREGSTLMDWPITESYCEAVAKAFEVPLTFSHRVGGFEREMLRDGAPTAAVCIPLEDGYRTIGGNGPAGTRLKFPQVSADLNVRFCSSYLKIGPFDAYINNHPKFREGRTLVLTGERAQESKSRANYKAFEPHRADNRHGKKVGRHVDHWRGVHAWRKEAVWDIIRKFGVTSHPAYFLGFGRASCMFCIFASKNQWATVRDISPEGFQKIADYERQFLVTIHRKDTVVQRADAGTPFTSDPMWAEIANGRTFDRPVFMDPWVLPPGAFGESCGPT